MEILKNSNNKLSTNNHLNTIVRIVKLNYFQQKIFCNTILFNNNPTYQILKMKNKMIVVPNILSLRRIGLMILMEIKE